MPRRERDSTDDAPATLIAQDPTYPPAVKPDDVVRALAVLIACEDHQTAVRVAAELPPFLELVDAVRASDGAMQLAQALDARRRATGAVATV